MRGIIEAKKARERHNALERRWSEETRLSQEILISILRRLECQEELLTKITQNIGKKKVKRSLTAYTKFFRDKAKEGKSAQEIGKLWREQQKTKTSKSASSASFG